MTYVVDVLERHSRLHPGQKKVSDLKYIPTLLRHVG